MKVENGVRLLAGFLVLVGLGLGILVNAWFFALVVFVGVNLMQSAFTGLCPAESILRRTGACRTVTPAR